MLRRTLVLGTLGGLGAGSAVRAQSPSVEALTLVYGFSAGGTVEAVAQQLVPGLRGDSARTVRLESRPGAAGLLAAREVVRAAGDGSVLLVTPTSSVTLVPQIARTGAGVMAGLRAVIRLGQAPLCYVLGPAVPGEVRTLRDYLRWVELNPDCAGFGSPGLGTGSHLIGAALGRLAQVDLRHIAYRGAGPAVEDLMSGQLPAMSMLLGNYLRQKASRSLRMLAITGTQRSRFMPEVPTYAELGFGALTEVETYAVLMPASASEAQAEHLADRLRQHFSPAEATQALTALGIEPILDRPESLASAMSREFGVWREVVEIAGLRRG